MTLVERIAIAKKREDDLRNAQMLALEKASEKKYALIKKLQLMCPRCNRKNGLGRMFFRKFKSSNEELYYSHFECSQVVCSLCRGETKVHELTHEDQNVVREHNAHMPQGKDIIDPDDDD